MSLDASTLLAYLAERSVAGSLVFLVALVGWWLLRHRLRPGTVAAWFLVPLVVFALPVEGWLPSPWAGANPIEVALVERVPAYSRLLTPSPVVLPGGAGGADPEAAAVPTAPEPLVPSAPSAGAADRPAPPASILPSPATLLVGAWLLVVAGLLARLLLAQVRVLALLRRARRLPAGHASLVRSLVRSPRVRLLETDDLASPATWGLGRRALVLPTGLAGRLDRDELGWVVGHELAHLIRWDHLVDLLQRLVQIAFFFHPAVWLANRLVRVHRELACDEAALAGCTPGRRGAGARALLEVAAFASGLGRTDDHAMVSLLDDKTLLRNRLMNLTRPLPNRRPLAAALPVFALAALAALAPAQFQGLQEPAAPQVPVAVTNQAPPSPSNPSPPLVVDNRAEQLAEAESAVEAGLTWLIEQQGEDGAWRDVQAELPGRDKIRPYYDDIGTSAFAVQALARHHALWPEADLEGRDRALVRGLDFLLAAQDELGCYGVEGQLEYMISHPVAMEAVAMVIAGLDEAGLGADKLAAGRASLERAVSFTESARNPYGAWRYSYPPIGDNGTMQSGRMVLGLVQAFAVGVQAAPATFAGAFSWFAEVYDPETGRTGCLERGDYAPRIYELHAEFPADKVELATAMHMILRTSRETLDVPAMTKGAGLLLAKPPAWSRAAGTTDFTYWMYGTRAMSVLGGLLAERWNDAVLESLLPHQLRGDEDAGAWPGADAWSAPGLRTYATALNSRTLIEVLAQG